MTKVTLVTTMKNKKLTIEEVKHIAKLANLTLSEEEIGKYSDQLSQIVDLISRLVEVVTTNIKETSQVTGLSNVFREDEVDVTRTLTQEQALSNAKRSDKGYFVVDSIFK